MKVFVTGTRGIPDVSGGVETHCEQLFPRIAMSGIDVTVARRASYVADSLLSWKGVSLLTIPSPRRKSSEAIVHTFRAVNAARRQHADIVHINAVGPALLVPYAKLLGMKVVFTHHGPDYDREKWGRVAKCMLKLGERLGVKYADAVIVISGVIRDIVKEKYNRSDGVFLIPNGTPAPSFCNLPEYFEALGISPRRYILSMSRFVPEKRLHDLIDAYSRMRTKDDFKLVIAGDSDFPDEYSASLKERAAEGGVVLTGFVKGDKLHSLLSHAACFALPSSHEGLPIALLEAMSYGLPAVVSDIPANLEVGLDADSYFHLGDVCMLASRLDEKIASGVTEVRYDMARYDWDNISSLTVDVYRYVL